MTFLPAKKKFFVMTCLTLLMAVLFLIGMKTNALAATTYTITYSVDGNTTQIPAQTKTHDVPIILSTEIPTKEGYKFHSWNTKADKTGYEYKAGVEYIRNETVTLYAQWTKAVDNSSTQTALLHYGKNSTTEVPNYELAPSSYIKTASPYETSIDTYKWGFWKYNDATHSFEKELYDSEHGLVNYDVEITYNDDSSVTASALNANGVKVQSLFTPMNKKGLKEDILSGTDKIGYTTRSGYGFTSNGYVNLSSQLKSGQSDFSGTLRVSMLYPENMYKSQFLSNSGEFNDMLIKNVTNSSSDTYTYAFYLRQSKLSEDELDTEHIHYTPMWYPDSTSTESYSPVTLIRGIWTPVGEVRYNLYQEYEPTNVAVKLNTYAIRGSLFDDMYTTHEEYRADNTPSTKRTKANNP